MKKKILTVLGLAIGSTGLALTQMGTAPLTAGTGLLASQQEDARQEEAKQEERAQEAEQQALEALEEAEAFRDRFRGRLEVMPRMIEVQGMGGGGFSSISVSNVNGVKTVTVNESGKQYVIKESTEEVEVAFVKAYGPDDLEQLQEDYPDLHMHVVSFPSSTQDGEVSLTINVKVVRKAADAEALKAEHPDAYEIYEKYANQQGGIRIRGGGIEAIPRVMLPRIDDMRIEGLRGIEIDEIPLEAIPQIEIRGADDGGEQQEEAPPAPRRRIIKT